MVSIQCMENSSAKSSASVLVVMTTSAVQGLLFTMSAAGSRFKANSLNLQKWFIHAQSGSMLSVITDRYFYEKV